MRWPPEPFRAGRTRKFSTGVLSRAENLARWTFLFGTHLLLNAAGGMKAAPSCTQPRNALVGKIAQTFKPGSIYMTPKKEERRAVNPMPNRKRTATRG